MAEVVPWLLLAGMAFAILLYSLSTWSSGPTNPHRGTAFPPGFNAVVTGGDTGIGYETVRGLLKAGADVVVASTSKDSTEAVMARLRAGSLGGGCTFVELDLADSSSIRRFAKHYTTTHDTLNLLVNNAGVMGLPRRTTTRDGFEMQIGVNHLGHFLLTQLLWESLEAAGTLESPARVVNVTSIAHGTAINATCSLGLSWALLMDIFSSILSGNGNSFGGPDHMDLDDLHLEKPRAYSPGRAYSASKLANIMHARSITDRGKGRIVAASAHPGVVLTGLYSHMATGLAAALFTIAVPFRRLVTKSEEDAAQTSLYLATAPASEIVWGGYFADCSLSTTTDKTRYLRDQVSCDRLWDISTSACKEVSRPSE